jgi:DNA-binding response OmpR family regulator
MTNILLIEDEPQTRENLALILRMEGFDAMTASNGRIGLEAATREKPDLILCDVSMPELDGFGVLRALRANPDTASIPLIFLTARSECQDQRSAMNLGADDYIIKPVEPDDLLAACRSRLNRTRTSFL